MAIVYYDFETRSSRDLKKVGTMNYLHTPDSDIICMTYRLRLNEPTNIWIPHPNVPLPEIFKKPKGHTFYAFNIQFDYLVHNILGKKYGFGKIELSQCVDVMALCGRYGYPQSLEEVCAVLDVPIKKDPQGKRLMKKIGLPPFKYTREEMIAFLNYAVRDVDSMCEVIKALPADHLSAEEQANWELMARINLNGLPININDVRRIYSVISSYIEKETKKIKVITDRKLYSINQNTAIPEWINEQGIAIPNLQAATVAEYLKRDLPDNVKQVLELRQLLGLSSIKKFAKLLQHYYKGRIYHNLRYYGGHTGRYAGLAFQMHNLPRAKVDNVDEVIKQFYDLSILEDKKGPVQIAKALIRPMIQTSAEKLLAVADYKTIEFVLLLWLVKQEDALDKIRQGKDVYVEFAATKLYHIDESEVTPTQRQFGKTTVLGAGYYLGWKKLIAYCKQAGLDISPIEADIAIKAYRETYWKVPQLWYALKACAIDAIKYPREEQITHDCIFRVVKDRNKNRWLTIKLPSGRVMYYSEPEITNSTFGLTPTYLGRHPHTKKWSRLQLPPNQLTNNIIQALARDVLMHGEHLIDKETPYPILGSVHDENIIEIPEEDWEQHWAQIKTYMSIPPNWCPDLPLALSGYCERRYRKD